MKRRMETGQWYTRREGVVRGPFPAAVITRYILLGRIRLEDELSRDRNAWSRASTLTGLLPHAMLNLTSWEDYQRYIEARMQVDERRSERRREDCTRCSAALRERRVLRERRRADSLQPWTGPRDMQQVQRTSSTVSMRTLLLTVLLATLVFAWLVPVSR